MPGEVYRGEELMPSRRAIGGRGYGTVPRVTVRHAVGDDYEMSTLEAMQSRAAGYDLAGMGKYDRHIVGGDRTARLISEASKKFLQTGHDRPVGAGSSALERGNALVRSGFERE